MIGNPIRHSLSPTLHNAAFSALGLDWVYVAFPVEPGRAGAAVESMRTLGLAGMSVTMPHKADAARAVDRLGPVAEVLGVVNTVSWAPGPDGPELVGESTDGAGYVDALAEDGFDPHGRRCCVLGTGGAARAVTEALAGAGASSVVVVGRRAEPAASCASLAGRGGAAVDAADRAAFEAAVAGADLLVNATPVGMSDGDGLPFGLSEAWLGHGPFVSDLIYAPAVTPLLVAARRIGTSWANGLGMLIHQAGRQIQLWTGQPAPLEAMSAAAVRELALRKG